MNLIYQSFLSTLLALCLTMAIFADELPKPKKPEDRIKHIENKTKAYIEKNNGGKGPCWEGFKVSLKTYADARLNELDGCKDAKKCVDGVVYGMKSDAKLAEGSAETCYTNCAKGGCKGN